MKKFDVIIAGEINMDLILYALPEELPFEREVLASDFRMTLGSSSAIVAHNLASLGRRVGFVTRVGKDFLGQMALDRLRESGVDVSQTTRSDGELTTGVTFLLHHGPLRRILTYPGTMSEMSRAHLDLGYLKQARHFHLSSLFLQRSLAPDLPALFAELKSAGLTLSLDTNDDPEDRWGGVLHQLLPLVDIFLPNEREALRITGCETAEDAAAILGEQVPCVAMKLGERGTLLRANGENTRVPGVRVTPVDTIGAGDSFDAGFLSAYLRDADWQECAYFGNLIGALSTLRAGGTEAFRDASLRDGFLAAHQKTSDFRL